MLHTPSIIFIGQDYIFVWDRPVFKVINKSIKANVDKFCNGLKTLHTAHSICHHDITLLYIFKTPVFSHHFQYALTLSTEVVRRWGHHLFLAFDLKTVHKECNTYFHYQKYTLNLNTFGSKQD